MKDHFISDDLASNPNVVLWLVRLCRKEHLLYGLDNIFVVKLRQDVELTNDGGSAIGFAAEATILKRQFCFATSIDIFKFHLSHSFN